MKMESIVVDLEYCSVACNNSPDCFKWISDSKILYAGGSSIIEHDFKAEGKSTAAFDVLFDHTEQVSSVSHERGGTFTTSRDGRCVLRDKGLEVILDNGSPLTCGDLLKDSDGLWTCAGNARDEVVVWTLEKDNLKHVSTVRNGSHSPLCVRLARLTKTCVLLIIGWTSCRVQVLYLEGGTFIEACELSGHEDWVRGIDVRTLDNGDLFVATCGQDSLIRVWRISGDTEENDDEFQLKKVTFNIEGKPLKVELETVLEGHTGWVYSVRWHPTSLQLLSASIDKSMIIWVYSEEHKVWLDKVRVGGVGGNNLGFFSAEWDTTGNQFLGSGFHGSFHLWQNKAKDGDNWVPGTVPGGHFKAVTDISWSPKGSYLLSCSSDQTTRLHGRWKNSWRELARPQVHGHDLGCISTLSEVTFVSGAEEKVLRSFQATKNFAENLKRITGEDLVPEKFLKHLPEGASVAALGLSNKAVFHEDLKMQMEMPEGDHSKDNQEDFYFRPSELNSPPIEEMLAQNTLWNEVHKLYGHGYEVFTVAASPDGGVIASACKAQSEKHANVILWDTENWTIRQKLEHHKLTVAKIAFSSDGSRILTVSRDRTWALWERSGLEYRKAASVDKTCCVHKRIIWACAFGPPNTDLFVTASRDKKVVVWRKTDTPHPLLNGWEAKLEIDADDSATAVACSGFISDDSFLLAIGLENGSVELRRLQVKDHEVMVKSSRTEKCHNSSVSAVEFCPRPVEDGELLASCSKDFTVKIFRVICKNG